MLVTVYSIISANPVLQKILKHEFNGKQSFMIGRTLRALSVETDRFNDVREQTLKRYAEFDESGNIVIEGNNIKIQDGKMQALQDEINDLLHTTIEINANPIPIDWLEDVKLTPSEMIALEPFISEE